MMRNVLILMILIAGLVATSVSAHEMRPAYLSIQEIPNGEYSVFWKVPALGDQRLALYAQLPDTCVPKEESIRTIDAGAYVERWSVACASGLTGQRIAIDGLGATMTDALVRIAYQNGSVEIARLTPDVAGFVVKGEQSGWQVAGTYFVLGVDHILSGLDHLLFVFALILLIRDRWMLAKTITAFTVAHSVTLAGATLGLFSLPQKPVEAVIALSIAFVAAELVKSRPGEIRTSERWPWVFAFGFGLLHGFGFAGALRETGLPQTDVPVALLTFNLGVEAGQLLFVALVLVVFVSIKSVLSRPIPWARMAAGYAIGTVSMIWLISRVASFGIGT